MDDFALYPDQMEASGTLVERFQQGCVASTLSGYAGTGKTTLMRWVCQELTALGWHVIFGAPTGKAASRLSHVVGAPVSTIHSLVFRRVVEGSAGQPVFLEPRERLSESEGRTALIVDEASMIGRELARHVEQSAGPLTQILYVGDQGQLRPVADEPGVELDNPHARLTVVRRQALDNPILFVATSVREGRGLTCGKVGGTYLRKDGQLIDAADWFVQRRDQGKDVAILCSTNNLRRRANRLVRHLTRVDGQNIAVGEQLVVLYNNRHVGRMNGETIRVDDFGLAPGKMGELGLARITVGEDRYLIHLPSMGKDLIEFKRAQAAASRFLPTTAMLHVDYGYALTVHKSQGSEFDDVCYVTDEHTKRRAKTEKDGMDDWRRLSYTAVTRAKQSCLVLDVP